MWNYHRLYSFYLILVTIVSEREGRQLNILQEYSERIDLEEDEIQIKMERQTRDTNFAESFPTEPDMQQIYMEKTDAKSGDNLKHDGIHSKSYSLVKEIFLKGGNNPDTEDCSNNKGKPEDRTSTQHDDKVSIARAHKPSEMITVRETGKNIQSNQGENEIVTVLESEVQSNTKEESSEKYSRIRLPSFENVRIHQSFETVLPGDVDVNITVLSVNPLIYEVDGLLDEEECDVLVAIAKSKRRQIITTNLDPFGIKSAERTFHQWDYDQNGYITYDEIRLLPSIADISFNDADVDDMFFVLKMDKNKDGKVDLNEFQNTDISKINKYFDELRHENHRLRNMTSVASWVWADEDDMMKFEEHGYFEEYHERLATITEIPSELWELSEPLQVKQFQPGQFQTPRQDSDPVNKDIPCCLYGDTSKRCRVCRYLSFNLFLNDVEEGGDLVFPLANHPFQNIMNNSGEWRGYYMYSKTTGSKFYFSANVTFMMFGVNRGLTASGVEDGAEFVLKNSIVIDNTASFEKIYSTETESGNVIKYQGKIIENTRISGYWWIPGQQRMHGTFFMWNRAYELYSQRAVDQSNRNDGCLLSQLRIKPKKGKAVFWYNHHIHPLNGMVGEQNQESITAHCEVTKGEKWVASSWLNIIGDGELSLRTWRRGANLLRDVVKSNKVYKILGTNEPKLDVEPYEREYYEVVYGKNNSRMEHEPGYHKYKPASNALQSLNLLMNDLTNDQLNVLAKKVHHILGIQCVPI